MTQSIMTQVNVSDIVRCHDEGMTYGEIANAFGISRATVGTYLKKMGLTKPRKKIDAPVDNPESKPTFGDKLQQELDRRGGAKPSVQFEIINHEQTLKGMRNTYIVDMILNTIEITDGDLIGKVDASDIDQLIAELQVIKGKFS